MTPPPDAAARPALIAVTTALAGLVVAMAMTMPARAQEGPSELDELLDRTEELEDRHERTASLLDGLDGDLDDERTELAELTEALAAAIARLEAVEKQLEIAEAELADAEDRAAEAAERHEESIERLAATSAELAEREELLKIQASAAHKYGGSTSYMKMLDAALGESAPTDVAIALRQLAHVVEGEGRNIRRLAELHDEHLLATARADQTRAERDEEAETSERARDHVAGLHDEQAQAVAEVVDRRQQQKALVAGLEADREAADALLGELEADLAVAREEVAERTRTRQAGGDGLVCPVPSGAFIDDWHFPRSGGRLHKGNDVFADRGEPVYAVADGTVRRVNRVDRWRPGSGSGLGGKTVSISTGSNTWWYYAHLDEIDDAVESGTGVEAGQRIGTVGNTGNARHTPPHLHIGFYPGGEAANPYPLIDAACR